MAAVETLEVFREIQTLVSDQLKVVSYKWLSRNFSVPSNYAKRLLGNFVEKHGNELKVVYAVSGWLKNSSQTYCIKLATEINLAEVKQKFEDSCSVQVYSVQACIPNDLALLWSAEFLQAEELFNQPLVIDNCLRDNRYSGVSNSYVNRTVDGKASAISQTINASASVKPKASPLVQSSETNAMQSSSKINLGGKDEKNPLDHNQPTKIRAVKESTTVTHANKKKDINDSTSVGGGSLASLWGRAPVKSKPQSPAIDIAASKIDSAEAQIHETEATDLMSSGDEEDYLKCKRPLNGSNNRKRRVVMDDSDDDEEGAAVNLASPDPPSAKPGSELSNTAKSMDKKNLAFDNCNENQVDIEQENIKKSTLELSRDDKKDKNNSNITGISLQKKTHTNTPKHVDGEIKKENGPTSTGSAVPKKRKVLKTKIDERGREVTEVVWEGEAADNNTDKSVPNNDISSRPPPIGNKAPSTNTSTNPSNKAGNKKPAKGGGKNAKQGNILSFFKKV